MADVMSHVYACFNLPLQEKLTELTKIIDQSIPNKDLQTIFPQIINNIFGLSFNHSWGLRSITLESNRYEFENLISFLEPLGPMFRFIYKLLMDPQLKYNFPLSALPFDLQMTLEKGRCPQFYADMLTMDSNSLNVVALALNPFDYYMFNFALYLTNNSQSKGSWENWNSVYFALVCDYLMHFLPSDPNVPVMPHIPHYTGKVPMAAPLQAANRPLSSSLLLMPDVIGISNQHSTSQTQSRNEIWRSETVLQVFIDIWMGVDQFTGIGINAEMYQRDYPMVVSSPERVRIVRVLVKHLHSFSAKHLSDPAMRSSALRKYARQIICTRSYHYIKHLVSTWPLDASFRLVLELWLSFLQPWRYINNTINQDRFPGTYNYQEEGSNGTLDASFIQFIAESFPTYTCIFGLVMQRFTRLDLSAYKNAVMLFRLGKTFGTKWYKGGINAIVAFSASQQDLQLYSTFGKCREKVFSQPNLVPILRELEQGIVNNNTTPFQSPDISFNSYNNSFEQSYNAHNGFTLQKWVHVAKQAISELNMSTSYVYEPIWSDYKKQLALEFVARITKAKMYAEKNLEDQRRKLNECNKGVWVNIKHWLMITNTEEEELSLEECKKVPTYLNNAIHYFSNIFELPENNLIPPEPVEEENSIDHSSFANSTSFLFSISNKLRNKPTNLHYMGDPDLMPITSYESTILVRMLHQIASRLNELYHQEFSRLWHRNDIFGCMAREVLQRPCTIHTYVKDVSSHQHIVSRDLPARLSLRRLGSHAFIMWFTIGYFAFRLFSYSGFFYLFSLTILWISYVLIKATLRMLNVL